MYRAPAHPSVNLLDAMLIGGVALAVAAVVALAVDTSLVVLVAAFVVAVGVLGAIAVVVYRMLDEEDQSPPPGGS